MAYKAIDIARYVINYCIDIEKPIRNLKLQKLLYYIQAAFLLNEDKPCFDDAISRWRHGPVVINVYNQFIQFTVDKIDEKQESYIDYILDDNLELHIVEKQFSPSLIDKDDRQLINKVVDSLIAFDAWDLVALTCKEDPWLNTRPNEEITQQSIKGYFIKEKYRDKERYIWIMS